ncbi:MAG TPA: hypothetical protein VFW30_09535 [Bryocella sp.]|nr:hypothetical protein [Bryocella sp.]
MKHLTECLVCSGTSFETFLESTFSGGPEDAAPYFLANRIGVVRGQIQRCENCGFTFTNPQFSPEEYDEIYPKLPAQRIRQLPCALAMPSAFVASQSLSEAMLAISTDFWISVAAAGIPLRHGRTAEHRF